MAKQTTKTNTETKPAPRPQTFTGKVVSTKMKDTAVVRISRYMKHAKYSKYMNHSTKIMAHDPGNTVKEGQEVTIVACRPISKNKSFKIAITAAK